MQTDETDLLPPNFPVKRPRREPSVLTIPRDLVKDNKSLHTGIQFVPYNFNLTLSSESSAAVAGLRKQIILPIPTKVNDLQVAVWEAESFAQQAASLVSAIPRIATSTRAAAAAGAAVNVAGALGQAGGAYLGLAINPFLWMLFRQPGFKEYNFSWTLTAANAQESEDIKTMINMFKENMLPGKAGLFYTYPNIALIKFYPDDTFMFRFKPCAIMAVSTDFTAAGPSFFKNTSAPTIINFTVSLKEIDLWTQQDYRQNAYR
jgi:hypothetical protein